MPNHLRAQPTLSTRTLGSSYTSPHEIAAVIDDISARIKADGNADLLDAEAGAHVQTVDEWDEAEILKGHQCACGCMGKLRVRPDMRAPTRGIPKFLPGHSKMDMTEFVEALNTEGFLTVAQAPTELGGGENTLRRAEGHGWISPQWRTWGDRQPMRI